jgi:uncharacterized membrane protein YraQ (UPF0718 family)
VKAFVVGVAAGLILIVSTIADRRKTWRALQIAARRLLSLLPSFLTMLAAVSIVLTLIPEEAIVRYLGGDNTSWAAMLAAALGSISLMPGFIAFPLAGILVNRGVAYMVLSAFTTTLMMVGVLTYPIETQYFGVRVAIVRNVLSLATACIVAILTGLYFGEMTL